MFDNLIYFHFSSLMSRLHVNVCELHVTMMYEYKAVFTEEKYYKKLFVSLKLPYGILFLFVKNITK